MPVAAQKDADAPIAAARILPRQFLHPLNNGRFLRRLAAPVAQRRSVGGTSWSMIARAIVVCSSGALSMMPTNYTGMPLM
jgi:hypothetical protein